MPTGPRPSQSIADAAGRTTFVPVAILTFGLIVANVQAGTFHLSAPSHQQPLPPSQTPQPSHQHHQHHHRNHYHHHHHKNHHHASHNIRTTTTTVPIKSLPYPSIFEKRNDNENVTVRLAAASSATASITKTAIAADAVATAAAASDTKKPLKLTLITSSSSSNINGVQSSSHSSSINTANNDDDDTESINHQQKAVAVHPQHHQHHHWLGRSSNTGGGMVGIGVGSNVHSLWHAQHSDRRGGGYNNDLWPPQSAPTATATPFRALQQHSTRQLGRHVCVEHQPTMVPTTFSVVGGHPGYNSLFPEFMAGNEFFSLPGTSATRQVVHKCCPGWTQMTRNSHGCTKPICSAPCQNGGKCVKPDVCSCLSGFGGHQCELDRNECTERKPCDHFCHNTAGSFYCTCRVGFVLQSDRESCRRPATTATTTTTTQTTAASATEIDRHDDDAFEARDMENDVQPDYGGRIDRIEKTLYADRQININIQQKVQNTAETIQNLKKHIEEMERSQQSLHAMNTAMRDHIHAQEADSRRLERIVDQLYKCRNQNSVFCVLQR